MWRGLQRERQAPGREAQRKGPVAATLHLSLWGPLWTSAHELDWSWFLFTSSSKGASGFCPNPDPLLAGTATSPRAVGGQGEGGVEKVFPILWWADF